MNVHEPVWFVMLFALCDMCPSSTPTRHTDLVNRLQTSGRSLWALTSVMSSTFAPLAALEVRCFTWSLKGGSEVEGRARSLEVQIICYSDRVQGQ